MRYFWNTKKEADAEKIAILKQVPLFMQLSRKDLNAIASTARLIEYKKGQDLYHQEDPPHAFYIVASGRVFLNQKKQNNSEETINILHEGEFFGELSLLTDNVHSVTAHARNDSLLLEIDKTAFTQLIQKIPALGLHFSRFLSIRLRGTDSEEAALRDTKLIAIYSPLSEVGKTMLSINLSAALAHEGNSKVILLDMHGTKTEMAKLLQYPSHQGIIETTESRIIHMDTLKETACKHRAGFYVASVVHQGKPHITPRIIAPLFSALARHYDTIVIDLPNRFDEMVQEALHQADRIFFVTGPQQDMLQKTADIYQKLQKGIEGYENKCKIVLNPMGRQDTFDLPNKEAVLGRKIDLILPSSPIVRSYTESSGLPYLSASPRAEYSRVVRRIARQIRNSIVGLALGSGAALGLAHIGILKVLEREDIPIDIVAGSSMGALIGALWTSGKSVDEIEDMTNDIARWRILKLVDLDFPHRAMVRGERLTRYFKQHLKKKTFSDTLIPLRITAVDLYSRQLMVLDEGLLTAAVRASVSIPGILAPARHGNHYLTDGGLLAPCPVRVLTRENVKKVIAVNVLPSPEDMMRQQSILAETYNTEKKEALSSHLWDQIKWYGKELFRKATSPSIVDVIMHSMQTMEYELSERSCEEADVVLKPIEHGIHVLNFNNPQRLIARGEEEALKRLDEIKQLVKS